MYSVIGHDGQVYGPVTMDALRDWARQGRVIGDTNLIDPLDGRVLKARDIADLHGTLAACPPVYPPQAEAPPQTPPHAYAASVPVQAAYAAATPFDDDYLTVQSRQPMYTPPPFAAESPAAPAYPVPVPGAYPLQPVYPPPPAAAPVAVQPIHLPQQGGVQVNNYISVQPAPQPPTPVYYAHPAVYGPPKDRTTAILLCLFLGGLGVHRFYLGRNGSGTAMLVMTLTLYGVIASTVWALVDLVLLCTGGLRDAHERPLA